MCIAASTKPTDFNAQDLVAIVEGYDKLGKVRQVVESVEDRGMPKEELVDVFTAALQVFYRRVNQ